MRIYPNPPNNPDEVKIMQLTFYCSEDNDLYQVLSGTGHIFPRFHLP